MTSLATLRYLEAREAMGEDTPDPTDPDLHEPYVPRVLPGWTPQQAQEDVRAALERQRT